jgi:IS5 family transposase
VHGLCGPGYRGVDKDNPGLDIKHRGKWKSLAKPEIKLLKRRQAIEPIIGHLKADHRMYRCHLKGELGDRLHAVLCAAGYNIRWLLRMIVLKGLRAFLRLLQAALLPERGRLFGALILKFARFTRLPAATPALVS